MKASVVTAPGETRVVDVPNPTAGPNDVLVKMRACGICGSDALYISIGGLRPEGQTPLGHEPAGEVVEVGGEVTGIAVGDHVVINPIAAPSGIIGNGGASGALAEYLLIEDAVRGKSLEVVPDHIPFEVAALNEPMAVARHGVNQCRAETLRQGRRVRCGSDRAWRHHRVQIRWREPCRGRRPDSRPPREGPRSRRRRGINSADEDVAQRLIELHGPGESMFPGKAGTDIYFDAAGAPAVITAALGAAKNGARLCVVAVHKEPVPVDFLNVMSNEITIVGSMGYPDEIFEVTKDLVANWEHYAVIVSHTIPFDEVDEALRMASTPAPPTRSLSLST